MSNVPLAELAASLRAEELHSSSSLEVDFQSTVDPASAADDDSDKNPAQQPPQSLDEAEKQDLQTLTIATAEGSHVEMGDKAIGETLVVRKGQQLQELVVSGDISQEQLRAEVENIVALLTVS